MNWFLSPDGFLAPTLSAQTQDLIRIAYGVLLLLTLVQAWPQRLRFFCTDRWRGYAQSSPRTDRVQNPRVASVLLIAWAGCAFLMIIGVATVPATLVNVVLARYFFIHMRWKGVLRGMGAPGFMTYWLAVVVCVLEVTTRWASPARPLAVLVAQIDFAFIMLSAGIYKLTAGYARNEGMEYGLVNPEWGYWWRAYRKLRPGHPLFRTFNHLAWGTEVVAAALMLIPATRLLGGLLLLASFVFIASQIRLGYLCEMVIVATMLFFHEGSVGASIAGRLAPTSAPVMEQSSMLATRAVQLLLWTYLALLPLAHGGLFYNFYARSRLPAGLQPLLERYTNAFGVIIWRVFSVDVVNFYILIHRQAAGDGARVLVSRYGWWGGLRFNHVGESITVTSLFTTLKYYPSNSPLFRERLLRYARTIACAEDETLVFEYVGILKEHDRFAFRSLAEYVVVPRVGTVAEHVLDPTSSVGSPHAESPIHEGARPGTYVPLRA
jgi:hypothetical protein